MAQEWVQGLGFSAQDLGFRASVSGLTMEHQEDNYMETGFILGFIRRVLHLLRNAQIRDPNIIRAIPQILKFFPSLSQHGPK